MRRHNNSIFVDKFLECLKLTRVTIIFKYGSFTRVYNYKPTPSVPIISKVLKELIYVRLQLFLRNDILYNHQFNSFKSSSQSEINSNQFIIMQTIGFNTRVYYIYEYNYKKSTIIYNLLKFYQGF